MCIRDRDWAYGVAIIAVALGAVLVWFMFPKAEEEQAMLAAVSYTHLRAHETVLDLVCRLLLEKKNKHTYRTLFTHLPALDTTCLTHIYKETYL